MVFDDYRRQARSLLDECNALVAKAADEKRGFTDEEKKALGEKRTAAQTLLEDAESAEAVYRMSQGLPGPAPVTPPSPTVAAPRTAYRSLGEFLTAVAGEAQGKRDNRLWEARASGLSEGISSDGGFLVPQEFVNDLMSRTYDRSVLASRCRRVGIGPGANGIRIPTVDETSRADGSRLGGVRAYWAAEGGTPTATKPAFGQFALDLQKLIALCYATDEMLADSTMLGSFIPDAFATELAFQTDAAIFYGDGAGKPLGLLSAPCLVTVAAEGSQTADTVNFPNVTKMWSRMWARSRANAVWLINQDVEPSLYAMAFPNAAGTVPAYMPANSLANSPYSTLFGRPILPIEQASTIGDVGDIVLADLSQYLLIDKGEPKTDTSIHVKFTSDEMAFRFVYRVNGAPTWKTALTPHKGTNTLSPFVALAAR
jgi:HK97 family phage major capsid protein